MGMPVVAADLFDDSIAATVRWVEPTTRLIAEHLLDRFALPAGSRVLDVGAGTGPLSVAAAERGLHPTAIDTAPILTDYVAGRLRRWAGATSRLMDVTDLRLDDDSFDAAFSVFTVMYLRDGVGPALAQLRRVLRPGAPLAVTHWPSASASTVIRALVEAADDIGEPVPFPLDHTDPDDLRNVLAEAGFTHVEVEERTAGHAFPPAEEVYWELQPFFVKMPQFRGLPPGRRAALETAMIDRARRVERGELERPEVRFHLVTGRAA